MACVGLDEMRQLCGGAGFLRSSGVASWWSDIAPFPTFEGVNVVMFQQCARLLFKNFEKIAKGKKPIDFFAYLERIEAMLQNAGS